MEGKRVLIITDGGGVGISIADACEEAGLRVPDLSRESVSKLRKKLPAFASIRNPVDLTGSVKDEHYVDALQEAFGEEYVGIVSLLWGPPLLSRGVAEKIKALSVTVKNQFSSVPQKI